MHALTDEPRPRPLVSIPLAPPVRRTPPYTFDDDDDDDDDERDVPPKRWYHYIPLCCAIFLLLAFHPSLLIMLVNYHLRTLRSPLRFCVHLFVTYTLSFLAFSSLIAVLTRDPGPVIGKKTETDTRDEDMGFMQALMDTGDVTDHPPGKWCGKCSSSKPERAHHCSSCGRCVLKMDHHCGWLGKCIGHRNYTSFIHLLTCITLLALYVAMLSISAVYYAFTNPLSIDEKTPLHELFLTFLGLVVSLVIGAFWVYHIYLASTNQTTLENLSPFLLLREVPSLPPSSGQNTLSNPPQEHELSSKQRRLVRDAHNYIRLYDLGWRKNWTQLIGWRRPWGWLWRLTIGGGGVGDGRTFLRNPRADEMLARLAVRLVEVEKDH
ncbi:zf-DHHC-domain-containing protein [Sparassis crispa]|uniref:Palmitoyltransferase n=1 Tax=Sparassis crispa TaxID=139825 RepID=A0A401GST1_9APHY|nr:zf-DHHC-domain-containing protein [Sparassis crispa]GBE85267.1 zf-DHHC-domain-containing protein [Sparassis crispa]